MLDGGIVNIGDAVPQDVPLFRAEQKGSLPNSDLWLREDANHTRVVFVLEKNI